MPLAFALSLVLILTSGLLLYQFWTGALAGADRTDASPDAVTDAAPSRPDGPSPAHGAERPARMHHAA